MYTFINMCTIKFGLYCYITLKNQILMYTAPFYYLHLNAVRLLPLRTFLISLVNKRDFSLKQPILQRGL